MLVFKSSGATLVNMVVVVVVVVVVIVVDVGVSVGVGSLLKTET